MVTNQRRSRAQQHRRRKLQNKCPARQHRTERLTRSSTWP